MTRWSDTCALIRSDLDRLRAAVYGDKPDASARYWTLLMTPEAACLALYRLAHHCHSTGWVRLASFLYRFNLTITGADIHPETRIGPACLLAHPIGTVVYGTLGGGVSIYARVIVAPRIYSHRLSDAPTIGNDVVLGSMSSVLGPVLIADATSISPGSLVDFSVPDPGSMVKCFPGDKMLVSRKMPRTERSNIDEGIGS